MNPTPNSNGPSFSVHDHPHSRRSFKSVFPLEIVHFGCVHDDPHYNPLILAFHQWTVSQCDLKFADHLHIVAGPNKYKRLPTGADTKYTYATPGNVKLSKSPSDGSAIILAVAGNHASY